MTSALDHRAWQAFLDVYREVQERTPTMPDVPTRTWNALMDRLNSAITDVRDHPDLLADLRRRVHTTSDAGELARMHDVLGGVVGERLCDIDALRADPRVGLGPEQIEIGLGVYLAERTTQGDPYAAEAIEDEYRDLTRIGGAPTFAGDRPFPGDAFLLQVDLSAFRRYARHDPALAAALHAGALPEHGLLQAFHSTTGDSRTDPDVPGGGGTLRYVPEDAVAARRAPQPRPDDYPAAPAVGTVLPGFRSGPEATDDAFERVEALQEEVYRVARNGSYSAEYLADHARNPFTARAGAVSHLGGLQAPDHEVTEEDAALFAARLPLVDGDDRHLLLLEVAADHTFDMVFGDGGRLEYWLRRSDVASGRFVDLVTVIRSQ